MFPYALILSVTLAVFFFPQVYRTYLNAMDVPVRRNELIAWAAGGTALSFIYLYVAAQYWHGAALLGMGLISWALIFLSVVDFKTQLIPDRFHWIGAAGVALIYWAEPEKFLGETLWASLAGVLAVLGLGLMGSLYEKWRGRPSMGMGDIKLLTWAAFILGGRIFEVLLIASIASVFIFGLTFLWGKRSTDKTFPFGPALAFAILTLVAGGLP